MYRPDTINLLRTTHYAFLLVLLAFLLSMPNMAWGGAPTMDEELLQPFLDKASEDAKAEIREKGTLSQHNAIALLMKIMFNHVTDLYAKSDSLEKRIINIESNMATKDDISNMATKDDIKNVQYWLMFAVAILAIFIPTVMTIIMWIMNINKKRIK